MADPTTEPTEADVNKSSGSTNGGTGDLITDAREEITAMAREGMSHPSTKPVLTGAAIGAVAGAVLPIVTWPIGLAAGAGYALYKRLRP